MEFECPYLESLGTGSEECNVDNIIECRKRKYLHRYRGANIAKYGRGELVYLGERMATLEMTLLKKATLNINVGGSSI